MKLFPAHVYCFSVQSVAESNTTPSCTKKKQDEKEKADDVPARLSKNEFVFTADAVRAAGGGSVNEGAKKMYTAMKQLEKKPEAKGMMA